MRINQCEGGVAVGRGVSAPFLLAVCPRIAPAENSAWNALQEAQSLTFPRSLPAPSELQLRTASPVHCPAITWAVKPMRVHQDVGGGPAGGVRVELRCSGGGVLTQTSTEDRKRSNYTIICIYIV
jgi:hypothetical protein